jgi:hypothetical protein
VVKLVDTHASGACVARHVGSSPTVGTMTLKESIINADSSQDELLSERLPEDPMKQAFDELFNPLLKGKPIFIEVNCQVPRIETGLFFHKIQNWGFNNSLDIASIDIANYSTGKKPLHEIFVKDLKTFLKQANKHDKKPMLILIRRFNRLKEEDYVTYKDLFLKLVSAKRSVGIIFETSGIGSFIASTELIELGETQPSVVDLQKVISLKNSS